MPSYLYVRVEADGIREEELLKMDYELTAKWHALDKVQVGLKDVVVLHPDLAPIQRQIGDLADLTTEAKDTLVAAINEAARTGGGSGSMDLRVADGYIQYSTDGGSKWQNLIAVAELKGADGAPGTPGEKGDKGEKGDTGAKGDPGAQGDKGDTGATGPQGETGPAGPAGAPGKDGAGMDITGAKVGQIAKITAVDASGVPTAWAPVDMPSGGGGGGREWVKIGELTTAEDTTEAMHIKFTKDVNGNLLSLKGVLVIGRALFSDTNQHRCSLVCNDNPYGGNANYFLYEPILRNGQFFTIYSEFLRADGVNSVAFTAFNAGNVKQNGGCASTINAWSPTNVASVQSPMRGVNLSIFDSGLLAGSKFEFWGVKA